MSFTAWGQIIVSNPEGRDAGEKIKLTFIDDKIFADAKYELSKKGYTIHDAYWGYQIYRDFATAMSTVEAFCGER